MALVLNIPSGVVTEASMGQLPPHLKF